MQREIPIFKGKANTHTCQSSLCHFSSSGRQSILLRCSCHSRRSVRWESRRDESHTAHWPCYRLQTPRSSLNAQDLQGQIFKPGRSIIGLDAIEADRNTQTQLCFTSLEFIFTVKQLQGHAMELLTQLPSANC